jgi:hypothetical protein
MQEPTDALETTARQLSALHDILQSERGKITGLSIDVMTASKGGLDLICSLLRTGQAAKALVIATRQSQELQRAIDDLSALQTELVT